MTPSNGRSASPAAVVMDGVRLPDCRARPRDLNLTPEQRRTLVKLLATKGAAGLEEWLKREEARDPSIRERLRRERERLEREARLERRRIEESYGSEKARRQTAWEEHLFEMGRRESELRARLDAARQVHTLTLEEVAGDSDLLAAAAGVRDGRRGFASRLRLWWTRLVVWLSSLWSRLLVALGVRKPAPAGRTLRLQGARGLAIELDVGALLRQRPGLMVEVRRRLKSTMTVRERMRSLWRRMLGREDYADLAQRMMEEELRQAEGKRRLDAQVEEDELERRLRELEDAAREEARRREADDRALEEAQRRDLEELARRLEQEPLAQVRDEVLDELRESGLVDAKGKATHALLERFATLLHEEENKGLPGSGAVTPGTYAGGEGEYERGRLLSLHELGAMELVDSLVRARTTHPHVRHILDEDIVVHREIRTTTTHVVLIFDTSGSMEEKGRLDAAKRVCLVLHRAVKQQNPDHRVDILAMSTSVTRVDLAGCWNAEPRGFTNHGAALREARRLLEAVGADRRLVYLITDGLPEAHTLPDGRDQADRPEACMAYARAEAKLLGRADARLLVFQLETSDPMYLDAARRIAKSAGGRVEALDPAELSKRLLVEFHEATHPA